jgi:hypothetical protein
VTREKPVSIPEQFEMIGPASVTETKHHINASVTTYPEVPKYSHRGMKDGYRKSMHKSVSAARAANRTGGYSLERKFNISEHRERKFHEIK